MKFPSKDIKRFESKFVKTGPNDCWIWLASRFKGKYGQFKSSEECQAHRFSYRLYVGVIPKGIRVLHRCDNPGCVNPCHLFLGTDLDNTRDMISKSRDRFACSLGPGDKACKGETHGMVQLTENQVKAIRRRYRRTSYHSSNAVQLAKEYGVDRDQIIRIVNRKRWKHI